MESNILSLQQLIKLLYGDLSLVKTIVEIGARDCNETLIFWESYPKYQYFYIRM